MFSAIIQASVRFRWFVIIAVSLVAALGLFELTKLPIDAVPDITNRQVQITTVAPPWRPNRSSVRSPTRWRPPWPASPA